MSKTAPGINRRKDPRVPITGRGDAMLFGPDLIKGIQILDISRGGVAFRYVSGYDKLVEPLEMDILWNHIGVFLLKVKIRVVSDFQLPNEYLLGVIPLRRCSAKFVDLTEEQMSQLEYFLEHYGMDDVASHRPHCLDQAVTREEGEKQWNSL